jgi:hypothetical protein
VPAEDYVREKLSQAVDALAVSVAPLQARVRSAVLAIHTLGPYDFVDDGSRVTFSAIIDTATSRAAVADEGTIEATTSRMSDDQALAVAQQIVELDSHYRPLWFFVGRSIADPPQG